jgi:hypothetical protein
MEIALATQTVACRQTRLMAFGRRPTAAGVPIHAGRAQRLRLLAFPWALFAMTKSIPRRWRQKRGNQASRDPVPDEVGSGFLPRKSGRRDITKILRRHAERILKATSCYICQLLHGNLAPQPAISEA